MGIALTRTVMRMGVRLMVAFALTPALAQATVIQLCGRMQDSWHPIRVYDSANKCEAARKATVEKIAARSCVVAASVDKCRADLQSGLVCRPE
jgi:hypothetical protein